MGLTNVELCVQAAKKPDKGEEDPDDVAFKVRPSASPMFRIPADALHRPRYIVCLFARVGATRGRA